MTAQPVKNILQDVGGHVDFTSTPDKLQKQEGQAPAHKNIQNKTGVLEQISMD